MQRAPIIVAVQPNPLCVRVVSNIIQADRNMLRHASCVSAVGLQQRRQRA